MKRIVVIASLCLSSLVLGCASGPRVQLRYATSSAADLERLEQEDTVWFEFREGDEVPLRFVAAGVAEGANETPIRVRATRTFWIVRFKNGPPAFSFDGEHTTLQSGRAALAFLPGEHGGPNELGLVVVLGRPEDLPVELR